MTEGTWEERYPDETEEVFPYTAPIMICCIEDCREPHHARGLCNMHYLRSKRINHSSGEQVIDIFAPFWAKVHKTATCWLWTGSLDNNGYGGIRIGGTLYKAHSVAYELLVGNIPEGLEPDHLCETTCCVNPYHLELVTHRVNILRGKAATKTMCNHGHPYTPENTYIQPKAGSRACIACMRERYKKKKNPTPDTHDFRDVTGDPMEKREPGTWRDWEHNQQRERTPGMGRR